MLLALALPVEIGGTRSASWEAHKADVEIGIAYREPAIPISGGCRGPCGADAPSVAWEGAASLAEAAGFFLRGAMKGMVVKNRGARPSGLVAWQGDEFCRPQSHRLVYAFALSIPSPHLCSVHIVLPSNRIYTTPPFLYGPTVRPMSPWSQRSAANIRHEARLQRAQFFYPQMPKAPASAEEHIQISSSPQRYVLLFITQPSKHLM